MWNRRVRARNKKIKQKFLYFTRIKETVNVLYVRD